MTEAQPLSLSEAQLDGLDERLVEVKTSLIHGFPIASAEQHLLWETRLKEIQNVSILYEVIVSIRKTMKDNEKTKNFKAWVPKGHIVQVIQAYYNKQYSDEDLEYIFPKYGDINGILVLYLGTRSQNHLFTKINMLPQDLKVVLAKQCGKEKIPSKLLPDWLNSYDKSPKGNLESLPRLYRWQEMKERKRGRGPQTCSDAETTKEASQDPPPRSEYELD